MVLEHSQDGIGFAVPVVAGQNVKSVGSLHRSLDCIILIEVTWLSARFQRMLARGRVGLMVVGGRLVPCHAHCFACCTPSGDWISTSMRPSVDEAYAVLDYLLLGACCFLGGQRRLRAHLRPRPCPGQVVIAQPPSLGYQAAVYHPRWSACFGNLDTSSWFVVLLENAAQMSGGREFNQSLDNVTLPEQHAEHHAQ